MNLFTKEFEAGLSQMFEEVVSKMGQQAAEKCLVSLQEQYKQIWKPLEDRVIALIANLEQNASQNTEVNQVVLRQKQDFSQEMKLLQEQLQGAVQGSISKLEQTLIPHLDEALVGKLSQTLQNHIVQVVGQAQSVIETLQSKIEGVHTRANQALDTLAADTKKILNNIESETKEAGERIEANYDQRLGNFFVAQKQHIANWNTNFEATLKQIQEKNNTVVTKVEQDMQKLQSEGVKALQALQKIQADSQNAAQNYQNLLQKVSEELKANLDQKLAHQVQEIANLKGKFGLVIFLNIITILGLGAIAAMFFLQK